MIVRPDPDKLLAGELGTWLASQGDSRTDAKATARKRLGLGIAAALVVAFFTTLISGIGDALKFGLFVAALGYAWGEMAKRKVVQRIKGGINEAIARALDMTFTPKIEPGEEFTRAKSFEMLPSYDRCKFEDCWRGTVGDRVFQLYEANLEVRTNSENREWRTVFAGSVITVAFARRFLGTTLVERAGRRKSFFGLGGEKEEITLGGIQLHRVDMVDPRFAEEFAVWSDDGVEARYLVHPEYIERLLAVEEVFDGQNIRALFCGGDLLLLLESGNLFESGSIEASDDRRLLQQTIDQFGTLADLAAKLNERPRGNL